MRVLLDTNILIEREDNRILNEDLQLLMRILNQLNINLVIHPKSIEDIERDKNNERKQVILSKLKTYNLLKEFPEPSTDANFIEIVGKPRKINDFIDNYLLFTIYRDTVTFLITEDIGIHKKANRLEISERILSILDAINIFKTEIPKEKIKIPNALKRITMSQLNLNDPIFDVLREDYPNFNNWFVDKARGGRNGWIYQRDWKRLGAILIYKFENEEIPSIPMLPKKKRLKISTMIVSYTGQKIGELFIKLSINLALENNLTEIYITHFSKEKDHLLNLIEDFGFKKVAILEHEWSKIPEDIFIKKIIIEREDINSLTPVRVSKEFYPNFCDGNNVKKHIIPIKPQYHLRLFTDFPKRGQLTLDEVINEFIIEGNTIKKAYLTQSSTKKIEPGDILLFYRSEDMKEIVSLGVVEKFHYRLEDKDDIINLVGRRTVYSLSEIQKLVKKPTSVILFNHHFYLKYPINYQELINRNILHGPPQSITEIAHKKYLFIKEKGGIDERFTFS